DDVAFELTVLDGNGVGAEQDAATVSLSGTGTAGDVWRLALTPTASGSGTVPAGGDLDTVATGLAATLDGVSYVAHAKDAQVTITRVGGGSFSVVASITPSGSATWPGTATTHALQLTGPVNVGDTWTLTVGGTTFT